jgi:tRNA uridine 5-carboxymethylaminomethyl modification enzyme
MQELKTKRIGNDTLFQYLKRPEASYNQLVSNRLHLCDLTEDEIHSVETEIKYEGYIARQQEEIDRQFAYESQIIPDSIDFDGVTSLSFEVRQKLRTHKPETVGQASRISGMTPAAISLLMIHLKRHYYSQTNKTI